MIKIGDFAKICNISTHTLRYYDTEGILKADVTDPTTGYRYYTLEAVEKYKEILFYQKMGFSLDEIRKLQKASPEQIHQMLMKKRADIVHQHNEQVKLIDDFCDRSISQPLFSAFLNVPFCDDPQVIGKWELCGRLLDTRDLSAVRDIAEGEADEHIYFLPGGANAWKYFWTKGILYRISAKYKFPIPNPYEIIHQADGVYMTVQFMRDDCIDHGADSLYLLYRQADQAVYTEQSIRPCVDKTDLPFVDDPEVRGEWRVYDYVPKISDFSPAVRYTAYEHMFMPRLQFFPRGICLKTVKTMRGDVDYMLRFTKGLVLNDKEMTAEAYQIKKFGDKEFLFLQHKSGDYSFGGAEPHWYVFEREETLA